MLKKDSWIYLLLLVVVMVLSMRFFFPLFLFLFIASTLMLLYLLVRQFQVSRRQQAFERTPAGRLSKKISEIREKRDQLLEELQSIHREIKELEKKLSSRQDISESTRRESREVLEGFRRQRDIRKTKLKFYNLSLGKLQGLLANYELSEQVRKGRKRLKELESEQVEEIAELEELRWDIEQDHLYLDSIEELEARLFSSDSLQSAERIQEELEALTRDLEGRESEK